VIPTFVCHIGKHVVYLSNRPLSCPQLTRHAWILFNAGSSSQAFIALVRGVLSSLDTRHLVLRMLSLLRIATAPVTFKLSPPSHQISPYSPLGKRTTFTAVLADASNSPTGDHTPPVAIYHLKGVNPLATDTQRFSFLTQSLPVCDIGSDAGTYSITNPDTTPDSTTSHSNFAPTTSPSSSFPVYGPFDLLYCVQSGGFGAAWAAEDRSTGRLLCLKVFQFLQDPDVTRSVQSELRMFRRMVKSKGGERGKQFIIELNRSIQHDTDVFFAMVSHRRLRPVHLAQCQLQELMTTDLGSYLSIEPERCKLHARQWTAQIVCLLVTRLRFPF
jgi:hypothetical protein